MLFVSSTKKPFLYIANTLFFVAVSRCTAERIVLLCGCELFYPIVESKLLVEIVRDTVCSVQRGFNGLYKNTRIEAIIMSIMLGWFGWYGFEWLGMGVTGAMLGIVGSRICWIAYYPSGGFGSSGSSGSVGYANSVAMVPLVPLVPRGALEPPVYLIDTNDILLMCRDLIFIVLRHNPLVRALNVRAPIETSEIRRIGAYLSLVLFFGMFSGFSFAHVTVLPIIVQNLVDTLY